MACMDIHEIVHTRNSFCFMQLLSHYLNEPFCVRQRLIHCGVFKRLVSQNINLDLLLLSLFLLKM